MEVDCCPVAYQDHAHTCEFLLRCTSHILADHTAARKRLAPLHSPSPLFWSPCDDLPPPTHPPTHPTPPVVRLASSRVHHKGSGLCAGLIELLHTQGLWSHSLRLAHQQCTQGALPDKDCHRHDIESGKMLPCYPPTPSQLQVCFTAIQCTLASNDLKHNVMPAMYMRHDCHSCPY